MKVAAKHNNIKKRERGEKRKEKTELLFWARKLK
jgi:hypothetical protein